eukprot:scaffold75602_cov63-Phaeocystis_antarctica.AAC.1
MASPEAQQQEQAKSGLGWNSHTHRSMVAKWPPLAGPSAPLGGPSSTSAPPLGGVALPGGRGRPPERPATASGARASCLAWTVADPCLTRCLPGLSGTWTRRRRRCSRRTRATCPTRTWRCAAASRPTAEGAPGRLPPSRTACLPSWVRVGRVRNAVVAQFAVVAQLVGLVGFRHCLPSCALRCVALLSECSRGGTVPLARIAP